MRKKQAIPVDKLSKKMIVITKVKKGRLKHDCTPPEPAHHQNPQLKLFGSW
jgi:hypothetical protein